MSRFRAVLGCMMGLGLLIAVLAFSSASPAAGGMAQCYYSSSGASCEDVCKDPGAPHDCCTGQGDCGL